MKNIFVATIVVLGSAVAIANPTVNARSEQIKTEYKNLRAMVSQTRPDGTVGGMYNEKQAGNFSILWNLSARAEVIRIFRFGKGSDKDFSVTYHLNYAIVPNRLVLRRFIGTEPTGWMNETVDFATGEYLGMQGNPEVQVKAADLKFLSSLGIRK